MNTTAKLLLHCPDQPGILAEVTNFITINKGNIVYLDQYVDHVENIFFMRIEWEIKDFFIPKNKIEDYLQILKTQVFLNNRCGLIYKDDMHISSISDLQIGDNIKVLFSDGSILAKINQIIKH